MPRVMPNAASMSHARRFRIDVHHEVHRRALGYGTELDRPILPLTKALAVTSTSIETALMARNTALPAHLFLSRDQNQNTAAAAAATAGMSHSSGYIVSKRVRRSTTADEHGDQQEGKTCMPRTCDEGQHQGDKRDAEPQIGGEDRRQRRTGHAFDELADERCGKVEVAGLRGAVDEAGVAVGQRRRAAQVAGPAVLDRCALVLPQDLVDAVVEGSQAALDRGIVRVFAERSNCLCMLGTAPSPTG